LAKGTEIIYTHAIRTHPTSNHVWSILFHY